ncbi:MAG TPA: Na+/H+ antiporter NhaA [Gaiellaceae bacterium]|nr:Na+/H+ antiporter NhaA [Gaiellaceae bacterium]
MTETAAGRLTARTAWARNLAAPLRTFLHTEVSGALFLLAGALAALVWVNSPWSESYDSLWSTELSVSLGDWGLDGDLHYWVNDGLMAIFFFVIGLEVRRELDMGDLRDRRRAGVPVLAAIGGMALPVAIYLAFTGGTDGAEGWGMVMPTDTAFALGVLALVGRRCPARLRVFVLTVVIGDDVGVLLVIAFAYTSGVSLTALAVAGLLFAGVLVVHRLGVLSRAPYVLLAIGVWIATAESGVHPTIAGVLLGLSVSARPPERSDLERLTTVTRRFRERPTPELARSTRLSVLGAISRNERLQYALHPWSSFVVVPLFALANAGVRLDGELLSRAATSPVTIGVVAGLVLGKFLGIGLTTVAAAHPRLGRLPLTVELPGVFGAAAVAGIGFTLSLFIAEIAFSGDTLEEAKVGVLAASLVAALFGFGVFRVLERVPASVLRRAGLTAAEPLTDLAVPVEPARDHVRGRADAPITLLEYGDYECPHCGRAAGIVRQLLADFEGDLRYVWRHLPLADVHLRAQLAAEAAEAAASQGAFWPYHDRLLAHQDELEPPRLRDDAAELGLDVDRFWQSLRSREYASRVAEDVDSADLGGVTGTPSFFLDGRRHDGAYDLETLSALVRGRLAELAVRVATPRERPGELG